MRIFVTIAFSFIIIAVILWTSMACVFEAIGNLALRFLSPFTNKKNKLREEEKDEQKF